MFSNTVYVRDQTPTASAPVPTIQFDPDGDVILVLPSEATDRTVRFQVNSHSLCLASSVFRAMLSEDAPFKEGDALRSRDTSSPPIEITLGDDEPKALGVLLRIVHLQFNWVPKRLGDDQLYQVAIVCDKYDMRQVLGPWSDQWIPVGTQLGGKIAGDQWLFIAYVFGRQALFTQLSKELILRSTADAGGSLLAPPLMSNTGGARSYNQYIQSSILAEISTCRQHAIKGMHDYIHQQMEAYRASTVPRCAHPTKTDLCDLFFLGFLQKTFAKPLQQLKFQNHQSLISIQGLKSHIDSLKSPDIIIIQAEGWRLCNCSTANNAYYGTGTCGSCKNPRGNHATTCSPLPELKRQIGLMLPKIQGLELSQFVRNTQNGGALTANPVPQGKDWWDYLDSW